jgi:hypothetical protein
VACHPLRRTLLGPMITGKRCWEISMFCKLILVTAIILGSVALAASLSIADNWHDHQVARAPLNGSRSHVPGLEPAERIDGLSIVRQNWRREGGFLIAEMTFANDKQFPVDGAIVTCDFFDPPSLFVGKRGSLIVRILPPGETTIGGIEFTMLKHNVLDRDMFGATCGVTRGTAANDSRETLAPTGGTFELGHDSVLRRSIEKPHDFYSGSWGPPLTHVPDQNLSQDVDRGS